MINLIDSINTIKGIRMISVPCGIKWEKNHLRKKIYIIIEVYKDKDRDIEKNP